MSCHGCPYFDPDYDSLNIRLNPPSVVVDNTTCADATLVKVDSANRHGILLEVVQILTDMDLIISKAYVSSDGGWFMDVFHVTDEQGQKLTDEGRIMECIQESLGARQDSLTTEARTCRGHPVNLQSIAEHTALELTGRDRPGLLSEVSSVLKDLLCNVVAAEIWTHNMRAAGVVYITDELTGGAVEDPIKLNRLQERLSQILRNDDDVNSGKTDFSLGLTHPERRLHQMMFADRDYERVNELNETFGDRGEHPMITISNCDEKGYSVVSLRCKDRPKLLFDTVCTLTDMQYVVFHASAGRDGTIAYQEYYIRHMNGCTLTCELEKQRVIRCLEAAIERRTSEGLQLELCTSDRVGLLSDVTRIFREHGLSVARADISTRGEKAVNSFYVTDLAGQPVDMKIVEAIRKEIGRTILRVKGVSDKTRTRAQNKTKSLFWFCNLVSHSERFLQNLGLVKTSS